MLEKGGPGSTVLESWGEQGHSVGKGGGTKDPVMESGGHGGGQSWRVMKGSNDGDLGDIGEDSVGGMGSHGEWRAWKRAVLGGGGTQEGHGAE